MRRPLHLAVTSLAFLALSALLVAQTLSVLLEGALLPAPRPVSSGCTTPPEEPRRPLELELLARLTRLRPSGSPPPDAARSLDARLLGTLSSADPRWSLASVLEAGATRPRTVAVGDLLLGAEVVAIERSRLTLRRGERLELIDVHPPPPEALPSPVRAVSKDEYELRRADVEALLRNPGALATQVRITPAIENGVAKGLRIFGVRPGSLYAQLGVQNGDLLTRVNGMDAGRPEDLLQILARLTEWRTFEVELERGGARVRKTVRIL